MKLIGIHTRSSFSFNTFHCFQKTKFL